MSETEEELIQRLVKEGLTKTETEDEKIQRLVKEQLKNVRDNKLFGAYMSSHQIKTAWESPESYYKFSQGRKPGQKLS